MKKNRIVITGIGATSPCGNDINTIWKNILDGKSGIGRITKFATDESFKCKIAGEVKNFDPLLYGMKQKELRKLDPVIQYGIAATYMALLDSKLELSDECNDNIGAIIGTGIGGVHTMETQYKNLLEGNVVSPHTIPQFMVNAVAGHISIRYKLNGASMVISSACASGNSAIINSFLRLKGGYNEVIITGGVETTTTPFAHMGFTNMTAMNTQYNDNPTKASMPFNYKRSGFVMGEGAGILIMETLEHARIRDAKIYAEVLGFGETSDAYNICAPDPKGRGMKRALELAIQHSNLRTEEINYINAHGTSTKLNDKFEAEAIHNVFGAHTDNVYVSSTKGATGHMLGAAGGIESIFCALAIKNQIVPPTINLLGEIDLDCLYLKHVLQPTKTEVQNTINCNYGFGGHNTCVVFGKYE